MKVIKSITDEIDQCIAAGQIGSYSLCQSLDQLIRNHLSEFRYLLGLAVFLVLVVCDLEFYVVGKVITVA